MGPHNLKPAAREGGSATDDSLLDGTKGGDEDSDERLEKALAAVRLAKSELRKSGAPAPRIEARLDRSQRAVEAELAKRHSGAWATGGMGERQAAIRKRERSLLPVA